VARGAGVACSHVSGRLVQSGGLLARRSSAHQGPSFERDHRPIETPGYDPSRFFAPARHSALHDPKRIFGLV
jgi:hypothetical protein